MTLPPSFPPPARPDLADRLLAAVAERDQPMAERLVQQWVHRRGLAALETLMVGPLLASQGAEAAQWLQERAGGAPLGVVVPAVQPEPEWLSESVEKVVEQPVELGFEPVVAQRVEPGVELVVEQPVEQQVEPVVESIPAAAFSGSWPQLALVPDGEPAPAPRALAPLRAWLPDADSLPLAS
ncbi:hypothetical protein KBY57_04920 [Cyanobium sp. Aljojuca 7D2]|uniref:hypothetical protein n=1 Tax=Cyanobium sp. Aljojuca 7D2 TaxID=2823698 RepID=UPI0020CE151C|nr:hypothetical protein [Cyanobium sp. Aljojuca 7D2]MCP9890400.1 hypothetical protein [Cyanobium sp. Aljojuca 7D2]